MIKTLYSKHNTSAFAFYCFFINSILCLIILFIIQ
uniref:Uncharacterized protein n=1 Tax=Polysiphonia sp. TaxID=1967842 RepID=A0A1Z1M3B7_9FLOR|nr:hypothetical protein [Polysiphonia sp.]